eukprot:m51a1_g14755 hypothetical protein (515) ;mRNA; f:332640-334268
MVRRLLHDGPAADERASSWALQCVFSAVPDARTLGRCLRVCRRWRSVILGSPSLWQRLVHTPATARPLASLPPYVANLDLTLVSRAHTTTRALASLFSGGVDRPGLVRLSLGAVEPRMLACVLAHAPGLEVLHASVRTEFLSPGCWSSRGPTRPSAFLAGSAVDLREAFSARGARCAGALRVLRLANHLAALPPALPELRVLQLPSALRPSLPHALGAGCARALAEGSPLLEDLSAALWGCADEDLAAVARLARLARLGVVRAGQVAALAAGPAGRSLRCLSVVADSLEGALLQTQRLPGLLALHLVPAVLLRTAPSGARSAQVALRRFCVSGQLCRALSPACEMPALVSLSVAAAALEGGALEWAASLAALRELELVAATLSADAFGALAGGRCAGTLRRIDLYRCAVRDGEAAGGTPQAASLAALERIAFRACSVSTEAVLAVAAMSPRLRAVAVAGCPRVRDALRGLLRVAPTVTSVDMDVSYEDPETISKLSLRHPGLRINNGGHGRPLR